MSHGSEDFVPRRYVLAEFAGSDPLLAATRKMREAGHAKIDTHTPYPVHGIEEALGIKKLKIPTIVFIGGLMGVLIAYSMMYFMNAFDFRINVGNRPPHSPPAFVPITFELMVLLGGTSAFFGVIALFGLPKPYHPLFESDAFLRASVDGFFLSVELADGQDPEPVREQARALGATDAQVVEEAER